MSTSSPYPEQEIHAWHWCWNWETLAIYVAYITYTILYLRMDVALCWTSEMVYAAFILLFCRWYIKRGKWEEKEI